MCVFVCVHMCVSMHMCIHDFMHLWREGCVCLLSAGLPGQQHVPSLQSLYLDTIHALEDLLTKVLQQNLTPQGLQIMVEVGVL